MVSNSDTRMDALDSGSATLKQLEEVGNVSYEGGDSGENGWYDDYRVWPADDTSLSELGDAIEDTYNPDFMLSVSPTDAEFLYVTVRETV